MNNLERLRQENPLVVCYTNDVVKNFTANGLLSIGASPAMSEAPEEAKEFYKVAGALLINIGTMTKANEQDILKLVKLRINKEHRLYLIQWQLVHLHIVKHFAKILIRSESISN